jgi:ubiquitin carboxyl-terminal hydrolase 7
LRGIHGYVYMWLPHRYVEDQVLEGDNQYNTDEFGKQDAVCSMMFDHLPPVLHLHLKRFEFNMATYTMEKVNTRFEFPDLLDLTEFLDTTAQPPQSQQEAASFADVAAATAAYAEQASNAPGAVYRLHSVLVHSGGVGGGHYYAFARPKVGVSEQDPSSIQEVQEGVLVDFGDADVRSPQVRYAAPCVCC